MLVPINISILALFFHFHAHTHAFAPACAQVYMHVTKCPCACLHESAKKGNSADAIKCFPDFDRRYNVFCTYVLASAGKGMQACKHAGVQADLACRHAGVQACRHASHICTTHIHTHGPRHITLHCAARTNACTHECTPTRTHARTPGSKRPVRLVPAKCLQDRANQHRLCQLRTAVHQPVIGKTVEEVARLTRRRKFGHCFGNSVP